MRLSALNRTLAIMGTHAVVFGSVFVLAGAVRAQSIFINELHYDNKGEDTSEIVEIAGPAQVSLTGWKLVLYNGKNGRPYRTVTLGGSFPDLQNGYGTLSFDVKGIENGAPDGIALVNPDNEVIHLIGYEGQFTASAGVAKGLVAEDIGVRESNSTLPHQSIQLKGSGRTLQDFHWGKPMPATPGAINGEQIFSPTTREESSDIATRVQ